MNWRLPFTFSDIYGLAEISLFNKLQIKWGISPDIELYTPYILNEYYRLSIYIWVTHLYSSIYPYFRLG